MKRKHITVLKPRPKDKSKGKKKDAGITMPSAKSFFLYVALPIILACAGGYLVYNSWNNDISFYEKPKDATSKPSDGRKRIDTQELVHQLETHYMYEPLPPLEELFSEQHLNELLWGTYRPHLYYGMRTRVGIDSLVFGMMWYEPTSNPFRIQLRHIAKSEDDISFQWRQHDGRYYGVQHINDTKLGIELTTTFVKTPGESGGDWVVRVSGRSLSENVSPKLSIMFYVGIDNQQTGVVQLDNTDSQIKPLIGNVTISGKTAATGDFSISFTECKKDQKGTYFSGVRVPELWQIEKYLRLILPKGSRRAQLENVVHSDSNIIFIQKFKTVPFDIDISFVSQTKKRFSSDEELLEYHNSLIGPAFEKRAAELSDKFEEKFENVFHLKAKGFSDEHIAFAKNAFSNLMGGIGYFFGHNRIYIEPKHEHDQNWGFSPYPFSLFTATPSRAFFPRGFLWDEGFHQLIISNWDKELSKDMLYHWISLINRDGWLAREQILGTEAESRVPPEFIVQYPDNANPPTLYFPLEAIIDRGGLTLNDVKFIRVAYNQLARNYLWYMKTQRGPLRNTFRWRGAKGNHTLPSGLDDYPRAPQRSDLEEHIDLLSWMIMSSNALSKISKAIDLYDVPQYKLIEDELIQTLQERYWNDKIKAYCDYDGQQNKFVEHLGYVSIFPLLFGLVPIDSPRLDHLLALMENDNLLRSNFGLRSLAKTDEYFGTAENYWRGPVWVNINYLTLRALHRYYISVDGPYTARARSVYTNLRRNLIYNMFKVWKRSGDIYENYNPTTGAGQGQHPFAGWSSLIVLIMAEIY